MVTRCGLGVGIAVLPAPPAPHLRGHQPADPRQLPLREGYALTRLVCRAPSASGAGRRASPINRLCVDLGVHMDGPTVGARCLVAVCAPSAADRPRPPPGSVVKFPDPGAHPRQPKKAIWHVCCRPALEVWAVELWALAYTVQVGRVGYELQQLELAQAEALAKER